MTETDPTLSGLRGEIDRLDDTLVDLLLRRGELVRAIGSLKGSDGSAVLRPGREAEILRRLLARAGAAVPGAAVVRIFREIISDAVRQQGIFTVAASMPDAGPSCWALARDQYGAGGVILPMAGPAQVAAAVADGAAGVGVVPIPMSEEAQPWWPPLMADGAPRVVARLPAATGLAPADGCTEGFVLALMAPEPSGDDRSLIAFEIEKGLGRSRVHGGLKEAGFAVRSSWSLSVGEGDLQESYLVEVDGFVEPRSPALVGLSEMLGTDIARIAVIGAFAVPPSIETRLDSAEPVPGEGS